MHRSNISHCWTIAAVVATLVCGTGPVAWAAGSAKNGKAIAQQQCSNCHLIEKNGTNTIESQPVGPDFMSIQGLTEATLKAKLNTPHPVMSKFPGLKNQQIADLVAYIGSVSK